MRAMGFCVGCPLRLTALPQPSQALIPNHNGDVAPTTTPVKRPSFGGQIEVPVINRKSAPANFTGLVPDAVDDLAPAVDSLMFGVRDELQVFEPVVLPVSVDVVEAVPLRDWSVLSCPDGDVPENKPPPDFSPEVSRSGDMEAVRSSWSWSCLSHEQSLTVSQSQVKSENLSARLALAV